MSFGAGFGVPAPAAAEVASAKDYVYLELESIGACICGLPLATLAPS